MYNAGKMREIFGSMSLAYLCGHLHNGAGLIPRMQHMHSTGVAELELSDWKKNRAFRIMTMDHDLFSFSDHKWSPSGIYVHISNPPEWRLTNPSKQVRIGTFVFFWSASFQPLDRVANSTHIRVLIFSEDPVYSASAIIDDETVELKFIEGNLWCAPWTPKDHGLVTVTAQSTNGKNSTISHQYKLHYESLMSSEVSAYLDRNTHTNRCTSFHSPPPSSYRLIFAFTSRLPFG